MKEKIINKAYDIFSEWIQSATNDYPDLNVQIKEVELLKNNFNNSIKKAKQSLLKQDGKVERDVSKCDYEYIVGYIEGILNVSWYHEYIVKQNVFYKEIIAVSVLESYLKYDELLAIKLDALYLEKYKSEVNIDNLDATITCNLPKEVDFLAVTNNKRAVLSVLENVKIKMIKENHIKENPSYNMNITKYLSIVDVEFILKSVNF